MVTVNEHLLICLAEECAEVQQAITKALRFGLDSGHPMRMTTNAQDITRECNDVIAIIQLIEENKVIDTVYDKKSIIKKKNKVRDFMRISKKCNRLTGDISQ